MRSCKYLLPLGLIILWSCNGAHTPNTPVPATHDNFIVLLDVGGHASNPLQVSRDITAIESIYSIFKANLNAKASSGRASSVSDKLRLLALPHLLYANVELSAQQADGKTAAYQKTEQNFNTLLPEIYKGAATGNNNITGADIRTYFNDFLAEDLDIDGNNTLFIITDGYIESKKAGMPAAQKHRFYSSSAIINSLKDDSSWETTFNEGDYGLVPLQKKINNLRVIVMEMHPKEEWGGAYSLLTKTWTKWLKEGGISNSNFLKRDSSVSVYESLSTLLEVKADTGTQAAISSVAAVPVAKSSEKKIIDTSQKKITIPAAGANPEKLAGSVATKEQRSVTFLPATSEPAKISKAHGGTERKNTGTSPDVAPPDESDAGILTSTQSGKKSVQKKDLKNEDDILQDAGAANGFNTGIKKEHKKKNP